MKKTSKQPLNSFFCKNTQKTINNHVKKVVTTMLIRGSLKKDQKTKNGGSFSELQKNSLSPSRFCLAGISMSTPNPGS